MLFIAILMSIWLSVLCYTDCRYRVLPNILTVGGASVALAVRYGAGGWVAGNAGLAGGIVCGLFLILPFILHSAGGGDVKMLFAVGCIMGLDKAAEVILFTSLAGILLMFVMLIAGMADGRRLGHYFHCLFDWRYDRAAGKAALPPKDSEKVRVPFGVAIAVGTWATLLWRLSW